ncbi:MAG: APC family permease [Desulfuromonadaceae bacterium]|nr:APC family permease [Desulfuromonadaceae bacterium]MDD5105401.1 APC family permease [Desulfuromonadaceae bacterium]
MREGASEKFSQTQTGSWEFAGWGKSERIDDLGLVSLPDTAIPVIAKKLGVWRSTAICGNDITSSCLYVAALCAAQAGFLAPVVLLIVAGVLYLFRKVYAEVGSALPLNGGTYTVLLNTTNKNTAAAAACLTLLSYIATAVISASEAMHYAHNLLPGLPVIMATVALLGFFALLNLIGIGESAMVALGIFLFHLITLTLLCVTSAIMIVSDPSLLTLNMAVPTPGGLMHALFFGFAAAMLGISGFESSANFIEEQEQGVFPKTLRNMWIAVAVFNPLISLLALGILPMTVIQEVPPDLLAQMGTLSAGNWLRVLVSIDATLVLSGAVLTSYVGVTGLVRRMTLDRCLPPFLLTENRWRHTNHWIIIGFFLLCWSILTVTGGKIAVLAAVYTLSFLCVMALFAIGNMLLKVKRARLPRDTRASWPNVSIALIAVTAGLIGNIMLDPASVRIFFEYYAVVAGAVVVMFLRIQLLKLVLVISKAVVEKVQKTNELIYRKVAQAIDLINSRTVIFFTKGDDPSNLNQAALYAIKNEQTKCLKFVHVFRSEGEIPPDLASHLKTIDRLYPALKIDFVAVKGEFSPELIEKLSKRLNVPKNYMFIGTPGDRFPHEIETLGGVRLIL